MQNFNDISEKNIPGKYFSEIHPFYTKQNQQNKGLNGNLKLRGRNQLQKRLNRICKLVKKSEKILKKLILILFHVFKIRSVNGSINSTGGSATKSDS